MLALLATRGAAGADGAEAPELSLEDLLKVEVTSVSRKSERLRDVAAAVFVISREDIERSGATSIPDLLSMAPGVSVARLANNRWAVSVRGFNDRFSNKLLVLMDGRSIYSPLFSGVIWENEDTPLEDIERIEVIRGPGAAMWGANAVNGVINIITRRARDTQGNQLVAAVGTEYRAAASFRHGGEVGDGHYRIWGKALKRDESVAADGQAGNDYARAERVGFRGDWVTGGGHRLLLSGQAYSTPTGDRWGVPGDRAVDLRQSDKGAHLLGRDEWRLGDGSEAALQAYVDFSALSIGGTVTEKRTTVDLDFQHRMTLGQRHDLMWGLGYRQSRDQLASSGFISFQPSTDRFSLASAFIHDDITLLPDTLRLMLGMRVEHNSYTGLEFMPNLRAMWTPTVSQSVWASVSRATRTPSRAERDARVDRAVLPAGAVGNPFPIIMRSMPDDGEAQSEKALTYELGYRQQFSPTVSADIAVFSSYYDELRAGSTGTQQVVLGPSPYIVQYLPRDNSLKARTSGAELSVEWTPFSWWRIQSSYSYLNMSIWSVTGDPVSVATAKATERGDPQHQFSLRSSMTLSDRHRVDLWLRHVSRLSENDQSFAIPAYTTLDLRYAWRPTRNF
ncbi:MAG: TonB-dependent receptor, partial [Propionivibrio sp.]